MWCVKPESHQYVVAARVSPESSSKKDAAIGREHLILKGVTFSSRKVPCKIGGNKKKKSACCPSVSLFSSWYIAVLPRRSGSWRHS
jgi:hypothetical protein